MKNTSHTAAEAKEHQSTEEAEIIETSIQENGEETSSITNTLADSESLGKVLKKARIARKITIPTVAKHLRISERYIIALEANDHTVLPERVYTLGFIRSYARYLDFDGEELVTLYKNQSTYKTKDALIFPAPQLDKAVPKWWLVVAAASLASLILVMWYFLMRSPSEEANLSPSQSEEPIAQVPKEEAMVTEPEIKDIVPETVRKAKNKVFVRPGEIITLEAADYTWIGIKNMQGKAVLSKTLTPDSKEEITVKESLRLTVGNAGVATLHTPHDKKSPMGKKGQSIHNFEIVVESVSQ